MGDIPPEDADMSLAAIEAVADQWAEAINLNAMLTNLVAPMRLTRAAPDDVRERFIKRMRENMDALVRQAFIEGACRSMDAKDGEFRFEEPPPDA